MSILDLKKKEFHYCINMIIKSNYHETNNINLNPLYIGVSKGQKFKPRRQRFERRWQGCSNQFERFLEGKTLYSTHRNQFWAQQTWCQLLLSSNQASFGLGCHELNGLIEPIQIWTPLYIYNLLKFPLN